MRSKKRKYNILVLNCGSSSLKYKIIRMPDEAELVRGEAERVGIKTQGVSTITHFAHDKKRTVEAPLADHSEALKKALELIGEDPFDVFAHRYVHPGSLFDRTAKISAPTIKKLKQTLPLAPIHNPISYRLIEFCHKAYPDIGQFAVFDTAFHKTIPKEYSTYAIPSNIARKFGIKKYGFHGISHRYVMEEACKFLKREKNTQRIISCHLGTGGSSVCAIENGRSINNSMGFTPLEGLVMNTRSGDLDLAVVFYMMSLENLSPAEAENILNKKSGILGIFNSSSDLRDVLKDIHTNSRAKMAFDMYVRRVRSYVSFYSLILKKADVLVFTDSLGTGLAELREKICGDMGFLGIDIDKEKNYAYKKGISDISSSASQARVLIIPTDEEIMIARQTYKELMENDSGNRS